ncbi:MAG TPA: hypothetical protein VFW94_09785 [Candidatus Acidoferrales bacterium]|nr:hypothetical protein [Candidatus Acidoferrales bacterium]
MMLQQDNLEQRSSPAKVSGENDSSLADARGFRQWVLGHYRFLYAADLILLYLSAMFYMMARVITGASSAASRSLLVLLIGCGIIAALPFVTGQNFEKDFAFALANPGSKKRKRIEIIVATALLLLLAIAVAVAIFHPAHHVLR